MVGATSGQRLILASASPRRKEFLNSLGLAFEVVPSDVLEPPLDIVESPELAAKELARMKAEAVLAVCPDSAVLGADTIVAYQEQGNHAWHVLGKPRDQEEARAMLLLLSGRSHLVVTGFCLLSRSPEIQEEQSVVTEVWFSPLCEEIIAAYLDTGEAFDKAGAYGIQGFAKVFVPKIEGSYTNVVGLPVPEVAAVLRRYGFWQLS